MSKSITSEVREMELKHDVQIFNEQVVQKQSVVKKSKKRRVDRPKKVPITILSPQEIKREDEPTRDKKQ
jgi:hypothetical protein